METHKDKPTFYPESRQDWRHWLSKHYNREDGVWLIINKKASDRSNLSLKEAVDEALCYGWIDSLPNKRDEESYYLWFAKRDPKSNWSRVNKEKIKKLIDQGLMADPVLKMVEEAKETGTWDALNDVENLVMPDDLRNELDSYPNAAHHFDNFPSSVKRGILEWIFIAKQDTTRRKRIKETAELAEDNVRANQYQK